MNYYTLFFYAILGGLLSMAGVGVLERPGYFFGILATVMAIDFLSGRG
jgi:hypothetical protein